MTLTITSFYTPDLYYARAALRLQASCERLGLNHRVVRREKRQDWCKTLAIKPQVILETVLDRGPCVWIDADNRLLGVPQVDAACDFMAVPKPNSPSSRPFYMGCLFFNASVGAVALLNRWIESAKHEIREEIAFGSAMLGMHGLRIGHLPPSHMHIMNNGQVPQEGDVVLHYLSSSKEKQASLAKCKELNECDQTA